MAFTRSELRKLFEGIEVSDEVFDKVMELHGKSINSIKEESKVNLEDYVSKVDHQKLITDYETLNEALAKKQTEIDNMIKEAQNKERNGAISKAISEAQGKNEKAILALLDNEKITFKDGKLEGLEDQLKALQKSDEYLFNTPSAPSTIAPKDSINTGANFIAEMQKL